MYIHELQDWPRFRWDTDRLAEPLASVRHRQGRLIGRMDSLRTLTMDIGASSQDTALRDVLPLPLSRPGWGPRREARRRRGSP